VIVRLILGRREVMPCELVPGCAFDPIHRSIRRAKHLVDWRKRRVEANHPNAGGNRPIEIGHDLVKFRTYAVKNRAAAFRSVAGKMTANSSPPMRATASLGRKALRNAAAVITRSRSPAA